MISPSSQVFESYIPVYDAIPDNWDEAKPYLVEQLKEHANAINIREIGWFLDEELLSGKQFIPSQNISGQSDQYRTILRKVIDCSPLVAGANVFPHGVTNDVNLTNIQYWLSATNSTTLQDITMVYPEVVINGPNINITSPGAYDRAFFFWEYIQEQ